MNRVSIIIPTHNRSRFVMRTLLSVLQQECSGDYEILVSDNASTDNTREVVERLSGCFDRKVRYLFDPRPGVLIGRHMGAKHATGDILTFMDDDVIAPPHWVSGIFQVFANPRISFATGNVSPFYETTPPDWLPHMIEQNEYAVYTGTLALQNFGSRPKDVPAPFIWSLNYHIRRDLFLQARGFNPEDLPDKYRILMGDGEAGLGRRIQQAGVKGHFDPRLSVYHTVTAGRMTREYFLKRWFTQGIEDSYTDIREAANQVRLRTWLPPDAARHLEKTPASPKEEADRLRIEIELRRLLGYYVHRTEWEKNDLLKEYVVEEEYYHQLDAVYRKYYREDGNLCDVMRYFKSFDSLTILDFMAQQLQT